MRDLSHKIGPTLQPVFIGKKLEQDHKPKEAKPSIVNQQCVVYHIVCDLCGADYVSYTARHLFQRVAEDLAIGKLFHDAHDRGDLLNESQFEILKKCQGKFDFLVFEMLYIKKLKPNLNVKADSIRAKCFVLLVIFFYCLHRLLFFLEFIEPSFWAVFDLIMTLWKLQTSSILNHHIRSGKK